MPAPPPESPAIVALIPARPGSQRVLGKNVRRLAGHPLLAYTITQALHSGIFARVIVSTSDPRYAEIARHYGAQTPFLRPEALAGPLSPDIQWVLHALERLHEAGIRPDCFSILRPTSPFRKPETIRRAWAEFLAAQPVDSLRAVEPCRQHPCKMWTVLDGRLRPLLPQPEGGTPRHSMPYQALPEVYAQNASLEIAWTRVPLEDGTIAGGSVAAFRTQGLEGFDINIEADWREAAHQAAMDASALCAPSVPPWEGE